MSNGDGVLNDILVFISLSFGRFLTFFFKYLVYFLLVLALTVAAFFINQRLFGHIYFFLIFLVLLVCLHIFLRRNLFLKGQVQLNFQFIEFLGNPAEFKPGEAGLPDTPPGGALKKLYAKPGFNFGLNKLFFADAVYRLKYPHTPDLVQVEPAKTVAVKKAATKYFLVEASLLLVLLLPFALISLFFTRGYGPDVQLLIYLLGFFFAYFLLGAVFDPLVFLAVQKKYCREIC